MTQDEQLKYCKVCKNRKFDLEQGTLCGKTGLKPAFEDNCEDYIVDDVAVAEAEKRKEEVKNSVGISGFLAFFVYWAIPISVVLTLISHISQWGTFAELGTYGILFEVSFLVFYLYFQAYTVYAFIKRKPDAVFIAKYQLIVVVALNVFSLLVGGIDEDNILANSPRLITSIVWCVVFFSYLCISEDVKALIPPETRKLSGRNKWLFILSLVIPAILYILAIFDTAKNTYGATSLSRPETQLEAMCKARRAELPFEVSEGLLCIDTYVQDKALVFKYQYNEELSSQFYEMPEINSFYGLYQKELLKYGLSSATLDDEPSFKACSKLGYDIKYVYTTSNGEEVSTIVLSKEFLCLKPK